MIAVSSFWHSPIGGSPTISKRLPTRSSSQVASFLGRSRAIRTVARHQPRLLFALDATASREPTWEQARQLHKAMFQAADGTSLAIQLAYYRGFSEFVASPWITNGEELLAHMDSVSCLGGPTQITRLVRHYLQAGSPSFPVRAMVFVGDALEEPTGPLIELAGQCRLRNQPLFLFQEGSDTDVAAVFERMAKLSGGAYARFDGASPQRLRELLGAVARYASGGHKALTRSGREGDRLLLSQLPGNAD